MKIILIVIDTLRADHLGCYGYFRNTSPNIDNLAREGVLFEDFHASAVATGPGFTSIFTGLFPIQHKFYLTPYNLPNMINFDDDIPTLPEMIWENGDYTTAAFDNLINLRSHMKQFVRGFEYYVNPTKTALWKHHFLVGGEINKRLLPWIKEHKEEDFFIFVHYWDPHCPYNQPEEFRNIFHHEKGNLSDLKVVKAPAGYEYVPGWGKVGEIWEGDTREKEEEGDLLIKYLTTSERTIDLYDGEIRYTDYLIGEIVSTLKEEKIYKETVIFITADHGEQLGQHGIYGHSGLHEANIKIPLIICGGDIPSGKRISGYAQHTDIVPTILDLINAKYRPSNLVGRSLLPVIEGKEELGYKIFVEQLGQRAILEKEWKYIWHMDGKEELYNIKEDPCEVINLVGKEAKKQFNLRRKLEDWIQKNLRNNLDPMIENMKLAEKASKEYSYTTITTLPWKIEFGE